MRNIRLEVEYDGTDYFGWQYQPNKRTIQGVIEKVLNQILQEKVRVIGAARTDAGVHAERGVANFKTRSRLDLSTIQNGANSLLPDDIFIKNISEVPLNFHARFDAKSKVYSYHLILGKSPLHNRYAWELDVPLRLGTMRKATNIFLGRKDYSIFCQVRNKNPWVNVKGIYLMKIGNRLILHIEADRFLYKIVRRIVGALVEIGRCRVTEEEVLMSFQKRPKKSFITAPPQGLVLREVRY